MDIDLRGEFLINGAWVDATGSLLQRQSLTHTRGRQDQGARVDPSTCRPLINNTNGQFSPDNPLSPYFGQFGRNTPFRLSVRAGSPALDLVGHFASLASTPDTAALGILGDIDIRVDATLSNWTLYDVLTLDTTQVIGKFGAVPGPKSWFLGTRLGNLYFEWSADGSNSLSASSTVPLPVPPGGRVAVRVTLDVDNGASGRTVTFYTAPSGTAGPWTQLGDPVVQAGVTSIFNSTVELRIGRATDVGFTQPIGRVHKAEVRNGIDGTVVASPDFTAQTVGAGSFADSAGRTWNVSSPASVSNRRTRLSHELAAYPTEWHPSGAHAWVDAQTAGVLRRLRRSHALDSTLRRRLPSGAPVAYWPLEDGANATQFYSPTPGVRPLRTSGFDLASSDTLAGSSALPTVRAGATIFGTVPPPPGSQNQWHTEFVFFMPNNGPATARTVLQWTGSGTVKRWELMLVTNGARVFGYNDDDVQITSRLLDLTGLGVFNTWCRWQFFARQNGASVDWSVRFVPIGGVGTGLVTTSVPGATGRITSVVGPVGGYSSDLDGLALGHIGVFATPDTTIYNNADIAFAGETAGIRMQRLASEESLPVTVCGVVSAQTLVGAQVPGGALDVLEDAADADGGILYEDRELPALRYRDRAGMYNQAPALVLEYNQPGLAPPLKPTGDDDATVNDVTVSRMGGSSARAFLESGPLSVLAPPNGVGVGYDTSISLNLFTDEQTDNVAGWLLHLGTYDGRRYPQVRVMVHKAPPALLDQILAVDVGDKLVIRNLPKWVGPGDVELIVQGYEETWTSDLEWDIVFNCTPGAPWTVAVRDDTTLARRDTAGSQLAAAATSTQTAISVLTTLGPLWTGAVQDSPYDVSVGGEVVTVTGPGSLLNTNPFFGVDTSGWTGSGCTISRSTAVVIPRLRAAASLLITPDGVAASGGANCTKTAVGSIAPGASYVASMWVYSPGGHSDLRPCIDWFDSAGAFLSTGLGSGTAVSTGAWTYLEQPLTAPANASQASVRARHGGTPSSSAIYYVWAVRIAQTDASWLSDTFGRTVAGTWGNADSGQAWTNSGGVSTDYDVLSGYGRHINQATSTGHHSTVTAGHPDFDIYCDITTAALSTGSSQFAGVIARYTDLNNLYEARVEFTTGNAIILSVRKRVAAVETQLGTNTSAFTHVAGTFVRVRFQGSGSLLRAKIWPAATSEPTDWELEVTDSAITVAGGLGVKSVRNAGNTNTNADIRFDNYEVVNPQAFTVVRSVNGIVKAQTTGTAVNVAQPATRAL
ncbi:hypothetical protein ABZ904_08730 [Streptomyces sp. NPDC046900]|uniref:hypothetical protein n=1 Tax=Streptomyces sp. NPDC046900 TaxID=3155473 RepID=UPI0033D40F51